MIRILDIMFSLIGLLLGAPVLCLLVIIGFFDTGSPLFKQERLGRSKKPFVLVKFRTMRRGTESVATHLADSTSITHFGHFLRKSKLDELPQLWNVLKGDMSLVGPRPNLLSQEELIAERDALGVYDVRPGITGLAQVNKIDMSRPKKLAITDQQMIENMSIASYCRYIFLTVIGNGAGDRINRS